MDNIHFIQKITSYIQQIAVFIVCCSLVAETSEDCILGSSALGKRNETAEETGKKVAEDMIATIEEGGCVDKYAQDQLIVFMALANGRSKIRVGEITLHTKTAIYIAERLSNVSCKICFCINYINNQHFQAKFEIINDGSTSIIQCDGIGMKVQTLKEIFFVVFSIGY